MYHSLTVWLLRTMVGTKFCFGSRISPQGWLGWGEVNLYYFGQFSPKTVCAWKKRFHTKLAIMALMPTLYSHYLYHKMSVGKRNYLSRLQPWLVFLILINTAKTKLAILQFLYCGEMWKTPMKEIGHRECSQGSSRISQRGRQPIGVC